MSSLFKSYPHKALIFLALFLCAWSVTSLAVSKIEVEINHLLQFIGSSNCTFIRNGESYPSAEAKLHINKKYNYVKSKVNSAEDFIKYAATKSSMTGKYYSVICAGKEKTSKQWLLDELAAYRNTTP